MDISQAEIDEIVCTALLEDRADADITTETLVPAELEGTARIIAKAEGVLGGSRSRGGRVSSGRSFAEIRGNPLGRLAATSR